MSLTSLTAVELGRKIKAKEVTAVEAMKAVLEQIKKSEGTVNAYVTVDEEGAETGGRSNKKKLTQGSLRALWPECRLLLRTICAQKACSLPAVQNTWQFHPHIYI